MPGERHGIIKTGIVTFNPAVYMGPGTRLDVRLPRGDKGLSEVDKISKAHDIRYMLAKDKKDIRSADQKMIKSVEKAKKQKKDNFFNIKQAELIKVKNYLEDRGLPKDFFVNLEDKSSKELKQLGEKELKRLEMQGYGLNGGSTVKLNTTYQDYIMNR